MNGGNIGNTEVTKRIFLYILGSSKMVIQVDREVKKAYGMHRILEHGLDTNVRNVGDATPGMLCFSSCGKDVIALERVLRRFTCDVAL